MPRRLKLIFAAGLSAVLLVSTALGAEPTIDPLKPWRDAPKISVLTFGPGSKPFERFGHNAIRVVDPVKGTDIVYNYGTFSFADRFVQTFLLGRMRYWLGASSFESTLARYQKAGRSVLEQHINLSPTQAAALQERLRVNALSENRYYLYDYYRDNCSTRIRDLLDEYSDGMVHKAHHSPAQYTFREHTLRHAAAQTWLYLALDYLLGPAVDQPITSWDEMFLPMRLRSGLSVLGANGAHGRYNFVQDEKIWLNSQVPKALERPPARLQLFLQLGLGLAAVLAFLGWEAMRRRIEWARWVVLAATGVSTLGAGALGTLLVGLWFTDHSVAHFNENVAQTGPWLLGAAPALPAAFRGSPHALRRLQQLLLISICAALLGLACKWVPHPQQDNTRIIAFCLPLWFGLLLAVTQLRAVAERNVARELRLKIAAQAVAPNGDDPLVAPGAHDAQPESEAPNTEAALASDASADSNPNSA